MKVFSALLATASFTVTLALMFEMMGIMSFFEQAFILWVCMPVGIGSIVAYFMSKTATKRDEQARGYMSQDWVSVNFK